MKIKLIISIALVLFYNTTGWGISIEFKANSAIEQLMYAQKLEDSINIKNITPSEAKKIIEAFKNVKRFFPKAKKEIIDSQSYLASFYSFRMRDQAKAYKILEELINTVDSPERFIRRYIIAKLKSLAGKIESIENESFCNKLCIRFPKYKNMIIIKYNVLILESAIKEQDDIKAQNLFNKVKKRLKLFVMDESYNNFDISLKIVQLLKQIPELELGREVAFRKKKNPNYKVSKAYMRFINTELRAYYDRNQISPQPIDLLREKKYRLFFILGSYQSTYLRDATHFVRTQMTSGKLNYSGKKLLSYIQGRNYIHALSSLKNYLPFLDNEDDKKCVQKVIDYFIYINKYQKCSIPDVINDEEEKKFNEPIPEFLFESFDFITI